jgi:creatinine amidohydrolase
MSDQAKPRHGILEEMTLPEVEAFDPEIVVIPVGSTEPHGPHLAYGCDKFLTGHISEAGVLLAIRRGTRALCYPTLPIGLNVNFAWPFALSFQVPTFMAMLTDLCTQIEAWGVRRILLVNGHGGNTAAIQAFQRQWAQRGVAGMPGAEHHAFVCSITSRAPDADSLIQHWSDHAGEAEVMELMAARPELVRHEQLKEFVHSEPEVGILKSPKVHWVKPWRLYLPEGARGETRTATREQAAKLHAMNAQWVADVICDLCSVPWSDRYPYA